MNTDCQLAGLGRWKVLEAQNSTVVQLPCCHASDVCSHHQRELRSRCASFSRSNRCAHMWQYVQRSLP